MFNFKSSDSQWWSKCAAYYAFTTNMNDTDQSDSAKEGECAMWVAQVAATSDLPDPFIMVGKQHTNGWVVTSEIVFDALQYVKKVFTGDGKQTFEYDLEASDNPLITTRSDLIGIYPDDGLLTVNEFKYGRSVVEVVGNTQLICNAYALYNSLNDPTNISRIELSVYQPRAIHHDGVFRKWEITPQRLHEEFTKLWNAANAGNQPEPQATAGPHCLYCKAASTCQALAEKSYYLEDATRSRTQVNLTTEQLSRELDFISIASETIKAREKAISTEALARAKKETIPRYRMVHRMGKPKITVPAVAVAAKTGVDPFETKICTPAELIRRGADEDVVRNELSTTPRIGGKLVKLSIDEIRKMFND